MVMTRASQQQHQQQQQLPGDRSSMIRKVRSLDFSALRKLSQDNNVARHQRQPNMHKRPDAASTMRMASKFSSQAHGGQLSKRSRSSGSTFLSNFSLSTLTDELDVSQHSDCSRKSHLSDVHSSSDHRSHNHSHNHSHTRETRPSSALNYSTVIWKMLREPKTVGYISVMMLLIVTLSDLALDVIHTQIHQLDSPNLLMYDSLSPDVISPPFPYKSSSPKETQQRPRLGLGSAAISSLTTTLSPILPFTGGVDLRREEHWDVAGKGWLPSLTSVVDQLYVAFGFETTDAHNNLNVPHGGSLETHAMLLSGKYHKKNNSAKHPSTPALSLPEPFLSRSDIADLTLSNIATAFEFATESNRVGYDELQFYSNLSPHMKEVVSAMDAATVKSRGKDVRPPQTKSTKEEDLQLSSGDVDALQFCAAMRIFAEWRVLRQVPDGFKGYAVGMNLGHKDVVQNILKIENAVHGWIDHQREIIDRTVNLESLSGESHLTPHAQLRSPTLRELLEYEIESEVHPKLPRLTEKSAAMGLLWVRRQLSYQTHIFSNVLEVPKAYPTAGVAVASAYSSVYDQYHGWAVQKIFNYSFQAAPELEQIYSVMNPHYLKEVLKEAKRIPAIVEGDEAVQASKVPVPDDDIDSWTEKDDVIDEAVSLMTRFDFLNGSTSNIDNIKYINLEGDKGLNPLEKFGNHIGGEWDKLGKHIGGEWDKLGKHIEGEWDKIVGVVLDKKSRMKGDDDPNIHRDSGSSRDVISLIGEALDTFVHKEMSKDAHRHITYYLNEAQPLVKNLAVLFEDLNMDDPTKV